MAQLCGTLIVLVLQVYRHGEYASLPNIFPRFANRNGGGITFGCTRQISHTLCEVKLTFREADEFASLHGGNRKRQGLRIGIPNVLARKNH